MDLLKDMIGEDNYDGEEGQAEQGGGQDIFGSILRIAPYALSFGEKIFSYFTRK